MARKRVLFISGSFGLGHVTRDLAVARELRRQNPEVELSWLASEPASSVLRDAGERILPEADAYANDSVAAEEVAEGMRLNLLKYLLEARGEWARNVEVFTRVTAQEHYDLVIGDETYEISVALKYNPSLKKAPYAVVYDFIGLESMTKNLKEKLGVFIWNRKWSKGFNREPYPLDLIIFAGELEDIRDGKFGFLMPNRRDYARVRCKFAGYIVQFEPAEYLDRTEVRSRLGYGQEPLVVCSIGGTAVGKPLLELCAQAFPLMKQEIPGLRMVLVCGPRLSPDSVEVVEGVEVRAYVPALYEHFAACDLAIVLSGGTSTLELTALRRPFLYFPLEEHFEQQVHVAGRLARHGAGVRMNFSQTTPELLAEKIIANLGREVTYAEIPTDGAQKAAQLISGLL